MAKTLREQIDAVFGRNAFARPLFYEYPGGLRFELSEGGSAIAQFLQAHLKATRILADVFSPTRQLVVCLSRYVAPPAFAHRKFLRDLRNAGVCIPKTREHWLTPFSEGHCDLDEESGWLSHIAFTCAPDLLDNLLWIAFATDFAIEPNPGCTVRIFDFESRLMAFPYDDRGMDIVGPNHSALATLFTKHNQFLLDYDRSIMEQTFQMDSRHS